jgi:hypothetical protein
MHPIREDGTGFSYAASRFPLNLIRSRRNGGRFACEINATEPEFASSEIHPNLDVSQGKHTK